MHWVEATHAVPAEFRIYEPLILDEDGENEKAKEKHSLILLIQIQ